MIYCVEDERNIRELIVYTLESSGFTARGLESGKELNAAIAEQLPDLILLDIIGWKHHLQCPILQVCLLPILVLSPLGEIAPNGEDKG